MATLELSDFPTSLDPLSPSDSPIEQTLSVPPHPWPSCHHLSRFSFRDDADGQTKSQLYTTVSVGGSEQRGKWVPAATYTVLTQLLIKVSPYFEGILQPACSMGWEGKVTLRAQHPDIFEWYLWWMHTGSLTESTESLACPNPRMSRYDTFLQRRRRETNNPVSSSNPSSATSTSASPMKMPKRHADGDLRNADGIPKYFLLFELYFLADFLMSTGLTNHILDTIARLSEETNSVPTPADTHILYSSSSDDGDDNAITHTDNSTNNNNPCLKALKDLVLDLFAYKRTSNLILSHPQEWHPRFMREVFGRLQAPVSDTLDRHPLSSRVVIRVGSSGSGGAAFTTSSASAFHAGNPGVLGPDQGLNGAVVCHGCHCVVTTPFRNRSAVREREARTEVVTRHGIAVLGPGCVLRCQGCGGTWCANCVQTGQLGSMVRYDVGKRYADVGACKPWLVEGLHARGFCLRYHMH